MPIPIIMKSKHDDNWAIIELQGDLQSSDGSSMDNKLIGDLHYTKDGMPTLIIGHHLLVGKEVVMEKPLALLEKHCNDNSTEYMVKSVIQKKILFRVRPKPIVGNI